MNLDTARRYILTQPGDAVGELFASAGIIHVWEGWGHLRERNAFIEAMAGREPAAWRDFWVAMELIALREHTPKATRMSPYLAPPSFEPQALLRFLGEDHKPHKYADFAASYDFANIDKRTVTLYSGLESLPPGIKEHAINGLLSFFDLCADRYDRLVHPRVIVSAEEFSILLRANPQQDALQLAAMSEELDPYRPAERPRLELTGEFWFPVDDELKMTAAGTIQRSFADRLVDHLGRSVKARGAIRELDRQGWPVSIMGGEGVAGAHVAPPRLHTRCGDVAQRVRVVDMNIAFAIGDDGALSTVGDVTWWHGSHIRCTACGERTFPSDVSEQRAFWRNRQVMINHQLPSVHMQSLMSSLDEETRRRSERKAYKATAAKPKYKVRWKK